ncbi:hypothetical protein [Streptomyces echinatus]|uniref:hypothetical protein n=1 Tax=Streptomyces echinatus TaxID=67293 RepID=UPI00382FE70F
MVAGHLFGLFTVVRKLASAVRSQRRLSHPILAADEVPGETSPLIGDAYPAALADAATAVAPQWQASATGVSMEER